MLHKSFFAAKGANGQAAANNLAHCDEIRVNVETLLGAAVIQPEAGNHLVKNQERAVFVA